MSSLFRMCESFKIRGGEEQLGIIGDRGIEKGGGDLDRGTSHGLHDYTPLIFETLLSR